MSRPPVLVTCRGGSPLSQEAARVAGELERLGEVRLDGGPGDEVVTLDGCASACAARRLAAEGRPPRASLVLDELSTDEIARRLHEGASPLALPRLRRSEHGAAARAAAHTADDYLLALDALTTPVAACGALVETPTLAAHVSEFLGVSRPTAGEMLARLERKGLVHRGGRKELLLTPEGRAAADRAVRRHRLLEVFVTEYLGFPTAESFDRARTLDAAFDEDGVEHLRAALGDPEHCPHGWPVDPMRSRAENDELTALGALEPGTVATVARVPERGASPLAAGARITVDPALLAAPGAAAVLVRA